MRGRGNETPALFAWVFGVAGVSAAVAPEVECSSG